MVSMGNYSQYLVINHNGKEHETEYLYLNHFAVCCCVLTLCDPRDCSRSGSCVLHYLLGVCSNSCPLSRWWYLTISFILCCPLLILPSTFLNIRIFSSEVTLHIRWPNIGASASVLPMNIQGWFPLGLTDLILQSKGLSRVFTSTTIWKHWFFCTQPSLWTNSYIHTWLLEKLQLGLYRPWSAKWCLCF